MPGHDKTTQGRIWSTLEVCEARNLVVLIATQACPATACVSCRRDARYFINSSIKAAGNPEEPPEYAKWAVYQDMLISRLQVSVAKHPRAGCFGPKRALAQTPCAANSSNALYGMQKTISRCRVIEEQSRLRARYLLRAEPLTLFFSMCLPTCSVL